VGADAFFRHTSPKLKFRFGMACVAYPSPEFQFLAVSDYDQNLAYWWPANSGFIWSNLNLPPGYTRLGSLVIGGNSMMKPGVYKTGLKELAIFYQNNNTGMVSYIADSNIFQPTNGKMVPNTTYNVNVPSYSTNPFIPNSTTPHILP
jgi:hypothetical protein